MARDECLLLHILEMSHPVIAVSMHVTLTNPILKRLCHQILLQKAPQFWATGTLQSVPHC